jgi:hypothetical protein
MKGKVTVLAAHQVRKLTLVLNLAALIGVSPGWPAHSNVTFMTFVTLYHRRNAENSRS